MNLHTLHYFLVAAEEENVTKAAERLYISQQALSAHIKKLEEEYGVMLFERKPFFRLTEAGRRMAFYSRQMLGLEEDLKADFSDLDLHAKGILRVGFSRLRSNAFFPSIWEKYYLEHPNISVDLLDGNRQKLADLLENGKVDIYIALDVPDNPSWNVHFLYRERSVCIFRRQLLQKYYPDTWEQLLADMREKGISLSLLTRLPFLSTRPDNILYRNIEQMLPRETRLNYILESNQQQILCQMAIRGIGAGLISPAALYLYTVRGEISAEDEDLCVFPLESSMGAHRCCLVYRRDWPLPRYAEDFIRDVRSSFSEYERFMQERFSL